MEKIKLNNQVVHMRKYVKQAKVHTINKLVKQVKLLQNRKGNEIQVQKAKRKAERFLKEVSFLKKVKPDYISKLALSKTTDWNGVLLQKNSALEDRCIAMLASYGPVQKEVESFHNSNIELATKISDLIKQWEEKKKYCKDSTQKKKEDFKKLENSASMQKINMKATDSLLNAVTNQLETTDNGNNEYVGRKAESSLLIDSSHEKKTINKRKKEKQNFPVEPSNISLPIEKLSEGVSHKNNDLEKKLMEDEESVNVEIKPKNLLGNNDGENESENDSSAGDQLESDLENYESESKNDSDMEENDDSEHEYNPENECKTKHKEIEDASDKKLKLSKVLEFSRNNSPIKKSSTVSDTETLNTCFFPMKIDSIESKSDENKLKVITVLNLDDLKDLDEIPVNNSCENDESIEEEERTDEDSTNDVIPNDPFFLSRDEAVSIENKLVDDPKSKDYVSADRIFERKEKSNNQSSYKKDFQKPLKSSRFSSRDSTKFKDEKKFKTFKKGKSIPKNHPDRFQHKSKNSFDRENSKNRFQPYKRNNFEREYSNNYGESKKKTFSAIYGNNKSNNSDNLHRFDNAFGKSKGPNKIDNSNVKPLHPSWEAKRKQKELINTSFQGKKVVFED